VKVQTLEKKSKIFGLYPGDGKEQGMKDFREKVAVVTGAASGIGRGIVERCAREGMNLLIGCACARC
jgi:hypothetical protein